MPLVSALDTKWRQYCNGYAKIITVAQALHVLVFIYFLILLYFALFH
jgi:hypothetical protein